MLKRLYSSAAAAAATVAATFATSATSAHPFRVAVVGSGPAGFYAAYRLLERLPQASVDIYEALPVPFGLARFGVAPDHPEVKNCQDKFTEVAETQPTRLRFVGNTAVGRDVSLPNLVNAYNSVLFAYGAAHEQSLGVPGEQLPGVYSARQFVGWYNGLPSQAGLNPPLENAEVVTVIGNGNVALDVARVLLCDPETRLKATDITEEAYEVLKRSRVRHVRVIGRRGLLQSAFTTKEIRELVNEPGVTMLPLHERYIAPYRALIPKLGRVQKRMMQVIEKASNAYDPTVPAAKTFSLEYLLSPKEFFPGTTPGLLSATECRINVLQQDDLTAPARAVVTNETVVLPNELVFKSIGYKAEPLLGMDSLGIAFDEIRGVVPNELGRVLVKTPHNGKNEASTPSKSLYVTGWVKTGPTGVIASTMREAFEVADLMVDDVLSGTANTDIKPGYAGVVSEIEASTHPVSWAEWKAIDQAEAARGAEIGKPRVKFQSVSDMLDVLGIKS
ncbi:uncharacterized protein SAPINGB_P005751 [Magnusiomyces paraingens]|uniref:NADPH:adrenodoxin oxidoreductase, mitochondrial n=1 Tax=Magnusiomyces paraingens TaxID=2606893 RepID=A0A5E8C0Z0_9ASCO|nr:uncharacterized protein SAPINGB_P005751 [Saprochaete ingens]VVT57549.1 unnamed protein product [Saprochaete ingens]